VPGSVQESKILLKNSQWKKEPCHLMSKVKEILNEFLAELLMMPTTWEGDAL